MKRLILTAISIAFVFSSTAPSQTLSQVADNTIGYVKASTFGKPDVAKKTNKLALSQVRVHYKIVTTRAAETRDNGARVTVYLDGAMTNQDLQQLTDEFYVTLQRKLGALGIEFTPWADIAKTEYYNNREEATAEKNNVNADGGNGQAWVSYTANQGPIFYRYDLTKGYGELLAYGKMKKINKFTETVGADFASFDVVVDFTAIELATSKDTVWQDGGKYLKYGANMNVAAMMSVPQSYTLLINQKNGFDQYASKLPIGQRDFFSGKPYQDETKVAYKTKTIFGDTKFAFTPVVIDAKRELYIAAARRALELYADMFVEKMKLIRGGAKQSNEPVAEKPKDNTTLEQVTQKAKENNEATAVTTGEMTTAAEDAYKAGKFQLAADYYGKLSETNPDEPEFYIKRSKILMDDLKQPKQTIKVLDEALKRITDEPALFYNRGTAYTKLEDWKKARKDFDSALALKPTYVDALLNRGVALLYLKEFDAALNDANRAIELNPRYSNLYRLRAFVYKAKGNAALAQADEIRAAQIDAGK
jgi:Flp pilus assembly protein TadD